MGLRIKEVCKEKNISLAEVAKQIGITPITLSQSLNGNPTLARLTEVADVLGVDVSELFERPVSNEVYGCLYVKGEPIIVNSLKDLTLILDKLK